MNKIKKFILKSTALICALSLFFTISSKTCMADQDYTDSDSGNILFIVDSAGLFSEKEEENLLKNTRSLTKYGNILLMTFNFGDDSATISEDSVTYSFEKLYTESFDNADGMIFVINSYDNTLYIFTFGNFQNTVTDEQINTILGNVHPYASERNYYKCAKKAFIQIKNLFSADVLAGPMKYICSALLALLTGFTVTFFIVRAFYNKKKKEDVEILNAIFSQSQIIDTDLEFTGSNSYNVPGAISSEWFERKHRRNFFR